MIIKECKRKHKETLPNCVPRCCANGGRRARAAGVRGFRPSPLRVRSAGRRNAQFWPASAVRPAGPRQNHAESVLFAPRSVPGGPPGTPRGSRAGS